MAHIGNKASYEADQGYSIDGQHRQFTVIDHDKKLKIATDHITEDEKRELLEINQKYTNETIEEILALPAVAFLKSGNMFAEDYIERDMEKGIIWREQMVRDALSINDSMRYTVRSQVWKNTVKETYWFEEMSHEDVLDGKWKEWI